MPRGTHYTRTDVIERRQGCLGRENLSLCEYRGHAIRGLPVQELVSGGESWLMQRILWYAKERDYTKYTSTLEEAWRLSVVGLSEQLIAALQVHEEIPERQPRRDHVVTVFHETSGKREYPMRCIQDKRFGHIFNAWADGETVFKNESQSGLTMNAMKAAAETNEAVAARVKLFLYRVPVGGVSEGSRVCCICAGILHNLLLLGNGAPSGDEGQSERDLDNGIS